MSDDENDIKLKMIKLDGNFLEGGGQIVRTGLALSSLLGKQFSVNEIRHGRKKPGLKAQHLNCVKALEELCGAKCEGVELGSESLVFEPGQLKPQTINIDIGTAGSITLMLQSLLLPAILGGGKYIFKIKGGTDTKWSMPVDYFKEVLVPQLRRYANIEFKIIKRGYFPTGGGEIELKIKGKYVISNSNLNEAPKLELIEQGYIMKICGVSHASAKLVDANVAERQARAAKQKLAKLFDCPINIRTEYQNTSSVGTGIMLWAVFSKVTDDIDVHNPIILGGDALGERGKSAEIIGEIAAQNLIDQINTCAPVDKYLADNLIPFLGFFGGQIKCSELTNHALTNIYSCEQFIGKRFEIDKDNKIINSNID
ncbi:RNA 3'-terminal phosphate cyclase [Candidatus Woesearchaeota archaeon]|jgi:RNA 3'-terminal phosphate cyclase (GTP)|nr:RNA 3'-terminal phosphate cyclase [Candidatus Woesearchaeota archaeon]MBT6518269.1 RNA 3'-terminal phosphate cyclase [Candidatus Woesearchaeota archaeon]MBT7367052.1 RNA 3'-terminal phosphate cyclase [Candidatus Woesearchaeota archaeon]